MGFRFQSNVIYLAALVVRGVDLVGGGVSGRIACEWLSQLIRGPQVRSGK